LTAPRRQNDNIKLAVPFQNFHINTMVWMKLLGNKLWIIAVLASMITLFTACSEENLQPGIPAFVAFDTITFSATASQGTPLQSIKDVWVFANGATIGVFEMPSTVPILVAGKGELQIQAGIVLNGIATTRVNNPFWEPIVINNFNFIPDSIVAVNLHTTYRESTVFDWTEGFEEIPFSLDTAKLGGTAAIGRTTEGVPSVGYGNYSGIIQMDAQHKIFEAATFEAYDLPTDGRPVLLEMHYKNTTPFSVGIIAQSATQVIKKEIIVLYPKQEWNKIYINFTDELRASPNARSFKVLVRSYITADDEQHTILLDNMKLMHR
jgi:hypothetical protein